MKSEKAICVTKASVDDLVEVLDHTVETLHSKGSKSILTDKEYSMLVNAKSEKEIYTKVKNMMETKGHKTLCLMTS